MKTTIPLVAVALLLVAAIIALNALDTADDSNRTPHRPNHASTSSSDAPLPDLESVTLDVSRDRESQHVEDHAAEGASQSETPSTSHASLGAKTLTVGSPDEIAQKLATRSDLNPNGRDLSPDVYAKLVRIIERTQQEIDSAGKEQRAILDEYVSEKLIRGEYLPVSTEAFVPQPNVVAASQVYAESIGKRVWVVVYEGENAQLDYARQMPSEILDRGSQEVRSLLRSN